MKRNNYVEKGDPGFLGQLRTFKLNIPPYVTTLGLSPAQVNGQAADADYFEYVLACLDSMQSTAQQWTAWKNMLRAGGTPPLEGAPVPPSLPATVSAVALGIEPRFRALVKYIKSRPGYNAAIGEALGIVGTVATPPDLTTLQPAFNVKISGGAVFVNWSWQKYSEWLDMCELQVDRDDGRGFGMLAFDTTPGYNDTAPWPATPTKWTYRAIFRVGDERVGQWSKPVTVLVG